MNKDKFIKIRNICIVVILCSFIISSICEYFLKSYSKDNIKFYDDNLNNKEQSENIYIDNDNENNIKTDDNDLLDNIEKDNNEANLGIVNINSASSEELQSLYRIGPALASKIIEYRETYGYFETIEEIKEVSGIGDATYEKIKEFIKVKD